MDSNRILFLSSPKKINELVCLKDNAKYAILDSIHNKKDGIDCTLAPVGRQYYKTSIVAGINKGFKYKRALDIGYKDLLFINKYKQVIISKFLFKNYKAARIWNNQCLEGSLAAISS